MEQKKAQLVTTKRCSCHSSRSRDTKLSQNWKSSLPVRTAEQWQHCGHTEAVTIAQGLQTKIPVIINVKRGLYVNGKIAHLKQEMPELGGGFYVAGRTETRTYPLVCCWSQFTATGIYNFLVSIILYCFRMFHWLLLNVKQMKTDKVYTIVICLFLSQQAISVTERSQGQTSRSLRSLYCSHKIDI